MCSYSGSEFALRVALCDLIERLKRSEHKCLYLEQCRNQFAKEIMRLRVENEYLTRNRDSFSSEANPNYNHTNSHSNSNSNSNGSGVSHLLTQINAKPKRDKAINAINNNNSVVDGDNDESWEEITVRLIKELRRDVAIIGSSHGNHANNALINESSVCSDCGCGDTRCQHRNAHNNYDTHYSSSIDPNNVSINEFSAKSVSHAMQQQISANKSAVSSNELHFNATVNNNNSCLSQTDNQRVSVGHSKHENYEMKNSISSKRTENSGESMDQTECINAFCYAIYYVKKDLSEVLHALTQQNEKLNRLKAKQLRSYFQRQLNFDHNAMIASNSSSKNDQKSNHDNY